MCDACWWSSLGPCAAARGGESPCAARAGGRWSEAFGWHPDGVFDTLCCYDPAPDTRHLGFSIGVLGPLWAQHGEFVRYVLQRIAGICRAAEGREETVIFHFFCRSGRHRSLLIFCRYYVALAILS